MDKLRLECSLAYTFGYILTVILGSDITGKEHGMLVLPVPVHLGSVDDVEEIDFIASPAFLEIVLRVVQGTSVLQYPAQKIRILLCKDVALGSCVCIPLSLCDCVVQSVENMVRFIDRVWSDAFEHVTLI